MEITKLPIDKLKPNAQNPRQISKKNFNKLVQSLKDFPEMIEAREIVVNQDYLILGGNMRYLAAKEAGITELPVKIVDWSEEKQREFIIKDNVSGGDWDWDALSNEWDTAELTEWGLDLSGWSDQSPEIVDSRSDNNKEVNVDSLFDESKVTECPRCHYEFEP